MLYSSSDQDKLQAYLLWLEARGLTSVPMPVAAPAATYVQIHEPRPAALLVLLAADAKGNNAALSSEEKELLRKILQAMQLDISREVCFGHITNAAEEGVAAMHREFPQLLSEIQPRAVMCFGSGNLSCVANATVPVQQVSHPRDMLENPELKREAWQGALAIVEMLKKP
jgi:hypothetical protein